MSRSRRAQLILGCFAVYGMASASSAALAAVGQREALIDAWERRQESVRTFHFSWLGTHFTGAEAVVVARRPHRERVALWAEPTRQSRRKCR